MLVTRKHGWIRDRADPRDFIYAAPRRLLGLPKKVDLRAHCSPVEDQGQLGSCTGNASVGALEFLELKHPTRVSFEDLSRLFAYYQGRRIEGTVRKDSGCEIRDVVKGLARYGTCAESLYPYDVKRFTRAPSADAYTDAKHRALKTYHRVNGFDALRGCLAEGYPVIFGFTVYESFEGQGIELTGVMTMPLPSEKVLGGHAVLAVGYDDEKRMVLVRNSWGRVWGLRGYFWMPYAFIGNPSVASDFWTIRR